MQFASISTSRLISERSRLLALGLLLLLLRPARS
jgi:hypothetical protein